MKSQRTRLAKITLLVFLSGCLYPSLPPDPLPRPGNNPPPTNSTFSNLFSRVSSCQLTEGYSGYNQDSVTADYRCGMYYGRQVYETYRKFLVRDAYLSNGFGYLMFAAGGAELGIAAAGTSNDSTLATAELGVGGGTANGGGDLGPE